MQANSILKNTSFLMLGNFLQRILSFVTAVIITRYLGPDKYGEFTFVIALVTIMEILWKFGLDPILVRDVSRDKTLATEYAGNMILTRAVLLVFLFPFILFYLYVLDYQSTVITATIVFVIGRFLMSVNNIYESIFAAFKRMQYTAYYKLIFSLLLLITVIFVTRISGGLIIVFLCYFFSFLIAFLFTTIILRYKFIKPVFSLNFNKLKYFVRLGVPFLLINFTYIIFHKVDHLMLSAMKNDVELGMYGSSYTLFEVVITFFPITIINAAYPVLAEYYQRNIDLMKSVFNVLFKLFLFIGLPISIGFILLGPEIILVLYGEEYKEAGSILTILGGSIVVFFMVSLISWTLTAANRQKQVLICTFIAMIVNLAANFYFIPRWGGMGAAWTTLISEIINGLMVAWVFLRQINIKFNISLLKILTGSVLMSILILNIQRYYLYPNQLVKLLFIIISSILVYFFVAFILKTLSLRELKFLSSN